MRRGHALDLGCGTGQLSVLLAGEFDRVTATDPSASQIASAGARGNIRYAIGTAEAIDLPPASLDLIVAAQAAHWFDLPAFYAEARRIAAPGAALALVSYGVPRLSGPAARGLRNSTGRTAMNTGRPTAPMSKAAIAVWISPLPSAACRR